MTTLYNRRADGALQLWSIETDGSRYRTTYGVDGGEEVVSDWTYVAAKRGTTPEEQCLLVAERKYKRMLEKGYSEDSDTAGQLTYLRPMLAHRWPKSVQWPLFGQPKLDGLRCILDSNGAHSRRGKPLQAQAIAEELAPLLAAGHVFDGELYSSGTFEDTCSLAKRRGHPRNASDLELHIYDLPSHPGTYRERLATLRELIRSSERIRLVPTVIVPDSAFVEEYLQQCLEQGYEGAMLRKDAPYESKRTNSLLKVKAMLDEDFVCLSILEGDGNRAGKAGSIECATSEGHKFRANIAGGQELCRHMWENPHLYVGRKVQVQFSNFTEHGVPRFPCATRWL